MEIGILSDTHNHVTNLIRALKLFNERGIKQLYHYSDLTDPEMVKYFGNCFLAMRVIFAEQIYDLCQALNINYSLVKEVAGNDPRIGHSHLNVFPRGLRGYDGPCLPKDVKTLIQFARSIKVNLPLLEVIDEINENLRKNVNSKRGDPGGKHRAFYYIS